MPEIIRNRTIYTTTGRKASSVNHRVHINNIDPGDTLIVNINHETIPFQKTFKFKGSDIIKKKSLSFQVQNNGTGIRIK